MNTITASAGRPPFTGLLFVLTAAFTFSAKAVIVKIAYGYGSHISPLILLTLRMVISLPFFLAALLVLQRNHSHVPLCGKDHLHLIALGATGFYLSAYLDFVGLSYVSATLERLILLLYPTLVILLSSIIFRRPITIKEATALLISYAGIVIVFAEELSISGSNIMLGASLVFGSSSAYALYIIGSGVMVKRIGAMRFTAYAMSVACLVTMVHFSLEFDSAIMDLPAPVYGLALLMAIVSTVIPTFLMNAGIQRIGANSASIISSMGPVMTLLLAYLFLDEQLSLIQLIGALLVMTGVYVTSTKR